MKRDASGPLSQGSFAYMMSAALTAALGGFLFGFDTAVISGAEDFVTKQFQLNSHWEGWFVSSAILGCILGVSVAGKLSDALGRKLILLLSALLFLLSAIGCAVAPNAMLLIIARLVGGLGIGIASMLAPLYISEFTPPHLRGRMVSIYQLAITVGIVSAYVSNRVLLELSQTAPADGSGLYHWLVVAEVWRAMFGVAALPALIFGLLLLMIPESPRWLAKQGRAAESLDILIRVNGRRSPRRSWPTSSKRSPRSKAACGNYSAPGWRIALLIGILLPFLSQVSGIKRGNLLRAKDTRRRGTRPRRGLWWAGADRRRQHSFHPGGNRRDRPVGPPPAADLGRGGSRSGTGDCRRPFRLRDHPRCLAAGVYYGSHRLLRLLVRTGVLGDYRRNLSHQHPRPGDVDGHLFALGSAASWWHKRFLGCGKRCGRPAPSGYMPCCASPPSCSPGK